MNDVIIHSNNFDISSPEAKENLKYRENSNFITCETNSNLSRSSNLKITAIKIPMKNCQRSEGMIKDCSSIKTLNITENVSPDPSISNEIVNENLDSQRADSNDKIKSKFSKKKRSFPLNCMKSKYECFLFNRIKRSPNKMQSPKKSLNVSTKVSTPKRVKKVSLQKSKRVSDSLQELSKQSVNKSVLNKVENIKSKNYRNYLSIDESKLKVKGIKSNMYLNKINSVLNHNTVRNEKEQHNKNCINKKKKVKRLKYKLTLV